MKSFIIKENDANQRLDKYLQKSFPNLPKTLMYKYIRTKRIKVNSKKSDIAYRLALGDVVDLYINDEFFIKPETVYDFSSASDKLDVIYEDENIIILNKPVGILCHPDDREYCDTLISRVKKYLYNKGEYDPDAENSFSPSLVNRIDRNTSGIVISAKNAQSLRILNQKMKDRELHKFYRCIIVGTPRKRSATLEGYLTKDEEKNKVVISNKMTNGAKTIITKYRVIASNEKFSLVDVELITGRTHQIRSHFASIGHPLLGDGKYSKNESGKKLGYKKQCLCSYKLIFDFRTNADILEYLNGKCFEISDIWFQNKFYDGTL